MDFRYLEAFVAVGEHLNFSKAASVLGITPAAVSRQIRLLEDSLDKQLFIRSPQSVVLTQSGNELFLRAKSFGDWTKDQFGSALPVKLKAAGLQGVVEHMLSDFIVSNRTNYNFDFKLMISGGDQIITALKEGRIDIAFTTQNIQTEMITSLKLAKEEIVLVSKDPISFKEIPNFTWITNCDDDYIVKYAAMKNFSRNDNIICVSSFHSALKFIEKGIGISMLPSHVVKASSKLNVKKVSAFDAEYIYMSILNYRLLPDQIKVFTADVEKFAKRYPQ
jgi:DNA-binding transcriptional LysR family regulator